MLGNEQLKEESLGEDKKVIEFLYQCLLVLEKQNKEYHEKILQMISKIEEILDIT